MTVAADAVAVALSAIVNKDISVTFMSMTLHCLVRNKFRVVMGEIVQIMRQVSSAHVQRVIMTHLVSLIFVNVTLNRV